MAMSSSNQVEQVPVPPIPPIPPAPPAVPGRPSTIVVGGPGGLTIQVPERPLSARDVQLLRQRGSELSRQLTSANGRRDELAAALEDAEGVNRTGIEQRISQLDQRIMRIEADIAENGRLLASAPAALLNQSNPSSTSQPDNPFGLSARQVTAMGIVGTIFVLFPLAIAAAYAIFRRGSRPIVPRESAESAQRMERLEQAVDAIALEVERISEGQRYVTRFLTEGSAPALSVGQKAMEPVRLPDREPLRASRESA